MLDAQYWNDRHKDSDTPWNLRTISPPLKAYMDQLEDKQVRILIPGAGHAHEARYLVSLGFEDVTICDISEVAIGHIRSELSSISCIHYICGDFFTLEGEYDVILEQTFFCALDPLLRDSYAQKMAALLSPRGTLAGLLFGVEFPFAGPPFGGQMDEYKILFSKYLYIHEMSMCYNSIAPRSGNEIFFICKKKVVG